MLPRNPLEHTCVSEEDHLKKFIHIDLGCGITSSDLRSVRAFVFAADTSCCKWCLFALMNLALRSSMLTQLRLCCVWLCRCTTVTMQWSAIARAAANMNSCGCRFLRTHPMQALFDFIDLQNKDGDIRPGTYTISTQFPRREFAEGQSGSLADNGLSAKQEAVLLILK